jgi:hypothetical protein
MRPECGLNLRVTVSISTLRSPSARRNSSCLSSPSISGFTFVHVLPLVRGSKAALPLNPEKQLAYGPTCWIFAGRGGDVRGVSPAIILSFTVSAIALSMLLLFYLHCAPPRSGVGVPLGWGLLRFDVPLGSVHVYNSTPMSTG